MTAALCRPAHFTAVANPSQQKQPAHPGIGPLEPPVHLRQDALRLAPARPVAQLGQRRRGEREADRPACKRRSSALNSPASLKPSPSLPFLLLPGTLSWSIAQTI